MRLCTLVIPACALIGGCSTKGEQVHGVALDTLLILDFDTLEAPRWGATVGFDPASLRTAVSPAAAAGEFYLFDATGTLVRRIGRAGAGPEEFRNIRSLILGDSLYVVDRLNRRVSVYSAAGDFVRSVSVAVPYSAVAWSDAAGLVVGVPDSRTGTVVSVRIDESGQDLAGAPEESPDMGLDDDAFARLAPAAGGGIWAARLRRYEVRHISRAGEVTANYSFDPDWFSVTPQNAARYSDWIDSRSAVTGITEDTTGLVWVQLGVPEAVYPDFDFSAVNPAAIDRQTLDLFVDDVLEAIDGRTGQVVAHARLPYSALTLLPRGYGWILGERPDGEPQVIVVRLRMEGERT